MLFKLYEFHIMSKLNLTEMLEKIKTAGYKYIVELIPNEEGVKLSLMTNNLHIETMISKYGEKDGYSIYEVKTNTKDDFMKMHDIMAAI